MEEDPDELSCLALYDKLKKHQTALSKYQSLYQRIDVKDIDSEGKNMLLDKSLLYPLLMEYDKTFSSYLMENLALKNTYEEIKGQLEDLITENESLNRKLKESLHIKSTASVQDSISLNSTSDELVLNLQHQLNISIQEKELAERKLRCSMQELNRLENSLQMPSSQLNAEIERLQSELLNRERKLVKTCCQVKDLQKTVENLKRQIYMMEKETAEVLLRKKDVPVDDLSANLEVKITGQEVISESMEMDMMQKVREGMNMVENAILLKKQAQMQCNQKDAELEKMQKVLRILINDAGIKTRKEVDYVRKQSNKQISKLTEELNKLEMENTERQSQSDRQFREKKALESELDKVYREDMKQRKGSLHTLNQRAINAEEIMKLLKMKSESLETELEQEKLNSEEMCAKVNIQIDQLQDCNATLELRIEKLHSDCLKYQDEINKLRKNMQGLLQEKETLQRKFQKEISTIEYDNLMKIKTYEVKIQTADDANRHAISEFRKILTVQQRMTSRWKEEYHSMTKKFETKMLDLRASVDLKEKQNEEVKFLLKESRSKTQDALDTLLEANRSILKMEKKVKESEEIAFDKTKKLAEEILKVRKLENEKQSLTKEILKLKGDV